MKSKSAKLLEMLIPYYEWSNKTNELTGTALNAKMRVPDAWTEKAGQRTGYPKKDYPGFDWDKVFRGDSWRFQSYFTKPGRWQLDNHVADRQGKYAVENRKQFSKTSQTFVDPEKGLMSTTTVWG